MRRFFSLVLLIILLSIFYWFLPAGQPVTTASLFGPEVFVRSTENPVVETWHFSTICFQGPFVLHLRNGEPTGQNRVSSAEVRLDGGLIFRPSDFSQKTSGYDIPVYPGLQSTLEVRLASAPGSYLKIWIEGTPRNLFEPDLVTVLPSGGRYRLSNGIKLEIPEGAVTETTNLQFRRIAKEEIMPFLGGPMQHPRDYMAGFDMEPRGFRFNTPVTISLPSEPRTETTSIPFVININPLTGDMLPGLTSAYSGPKAMGLNALATAEAGDPPYVTYDCTTMEVRLVDLSDVSGTDWVKVVVKIDKVLAESDCIDNPCRCCKIKVVAEESEIVTGACRNIRASGTVQYMDCPGQPKEGWNIDEKSISSIIFSLTPDQRSIKIGEQLSLTVTPVDEDGNKMPELPVSLTWNTNEFLETTKLEYSYVLKGVKSGTTIITADAGCGITDELQIIVESEEPEIARIEISPKEAFIAKGFPYAFSAKAFDVNGKELLGKKIEISSQDSTLAFETDENLFIGLSEGWVGIQAECQGKVDVAVLGVLADHSSETMGLNGFWSGPKPNDPLGYFAYSIQDKFDGFITISGSIPTGTSIVPLVGNTFRVTKTVGDYTFEDVFTYTGSLIGVLSTTRWIDRYGVEHTQVNYGGTVYVSRHNVSGLWKSTWGGGTFYYSFQQQPAPIDFMGTANLNGNYSWFSNGRLMTASINGGIVWVKSIWVGYTGFDFDFSNDNRMSGNLGTIIRIRLN